MTQKLNAKAQQKIDLFPNRISLEIMRNIWNDNCNNFSDEQLLKVRDFAYLLMGAIIKVAKEKSTNNIIQLEPNGNEKENSNSIYPSEYRRAS